MSMKKYGLLTVNAVLWLFASYKILKKGLSALCEDHRVWIIILALVIGTGFFMMFRSISRKYAARVLNLEGERHPIYRFMSLKGYLNIGFMMSLGMGISFIPGVPAWLFAFFYPALGFGLLSGSVRFFIAAIRNLRQDL